MAKLPKLVVLFGAASMSLLSALTPVSISLNQSEFSTFPVVSIDNGAAHAKYRAPGGKRAQRTEASGSRGCSNSIPVALSLLAPNDHVARTTSARPTFLWHVSGKTSAPLEFTLTEPGKSQPIYTERLKADKAGIMQLKIPQEASELAVDREYRWTVQIICNKNRPSQNINARALIQRVPSTGKLQQKLAGATSERERAMAYMESSIWYDGAAILNQLQANNSRDKPRDKQAVDYFVSVLEQVGLNRVATLERQRLTN
jgi:Domain of Unknown Function (DUF928)